MEICGDSSYLGMLLNYNGNFSKGKFEHLDQA